MLVVKWNVGDSDVLSKALAWVIKGPACLSHEIGHRVPASNGLKSWLMKDQVLAALYSKCPMALMRIGALKHCQSPQKGPDWRNNVQCTYMPCLKETS